MFLFRKKVSKTPEINKFERNGEVLDKIALDMAIIAARDAVGYLKARIQNGDRSPEYRSPEYKYNGEFYFENFYNETRISYESNTVLNNCLLLFCDYGMMSISEFELSTFQYAVGPRFEKFFDEKVKKALGEYSDICISVSNSWHTEQKYDRNYDLADVHYPSIRISVCKTNYVERKPILRAW